MEKTYAWAQTTTGHVMSVDGVNRWFVWKNGHCFEIYEIVKQPNGTLLRSERFDLNSAKEYAYKMECYEHNSRYRMEEVEI